MHHGSFDHIQFIKRCLGNCVESSQDGGACFLMNSALLVPISVIWFIGIVNAIPTDTGVNHSISDEFRRLPLFLYDVVRGSSTG